MGATALVLLVIAPLFMVLQRFWHPATILTPLLFLSTAISCLSALFPIDPVVIGFGHTPLSIGLHPALLHPVMLSEAVASATAFQKWRHKVPQSAFIARGAVLGLVLGLPFASWLSMMWSQAIVHITVVCVTAFLGIWLIYSKGVHASPERKQWIRPSTTTRLIVVSFIAIALQYSAMFSVFSNSMSYLMSKPGLDEPSAAAMMVIFGIGGVAGVMLVGKFLQRLGLLVTIGPPLALAFTYLLLFLCVNDLSPLSVLTILIWGAIHAISMLTTQEIFRRQACQVPEVATVIHACAASIGVIGGVICTAQVSNFLGATGIILSGLTLSGASLLAVWMQWIEMKASQLLSPFERQTSS